MWVELRERKAFVKHGLASKRVLYNDVCDELIEGVYPT